MAKRKPNNRNSSGDNAQAPNRRPTDEAVRRGGRDDALVNEAEEAVNAMETRELRRDSAYRTGGDDHSPGIDTEMDANAPKGQALTGRRKGGSPVKND